MSSRIELSLGSRRPERLEAALKKRPLVDIDRTTNKHIRS